MARDLTQQEDQVFENEVRRFARLLYPGNDARGAAIAAGRERDGIFITDDAVVIIEATRSTKLAKAQHDVPKLVNGVRMYSRQYPEKAIKGLFITAQEPTADQRGVVDKAGAQVSALSFATFQSQLIDAPQYISDRRQYQFGSAINPVTDKPEDGNYIELDLLAMPGGERFPVDRILGDVESGACIVLTGEYGVGKSMTLREVFYRSAKRVLNGTSTWFCIHLNLRDHQGQTDPAEALSRHAQRTGFGNGSQLVRAWRSGRAGVLLDGFDEISSSTNWPGRVGSLRDVRRRSMALVRNFVEQSPASCGVLVAGRSHFFDDEVEMRRTLSLPPGTVLLSASDFSRDQVDEYLRSRGFNDFIPDWLRPRPLLIGHLAARKVLEDLSAADLNDRAEGWNYLLDAIAAREARVDVGVDSFAVRRLLERLATSARRSTSGLGPLAFDEIIDAFRDVMSYAPDPESYILLQRLPGLQTYQAAENTRIFIDDELVDALRAGDVVRFVLDARMAEKSRRLLYKGWATVMGEIGVLLAVHLVERTSSARVAVAHALKRSYIRGEETTGLTTDLFRVVLGRGDVVEVACEVVSVVIPYLDVPTGASAPDVILRDCIIETLDVSEASDIGSLPQMEGCHVEYVIGATGVDALRNERIRDCRFNAFSESAETTAAILALPISDYRRVTLSILHKLYERSGKGRKELAFYRGALTESQKTLIPDVLEHLQSHDAAWKGKYRGTALWSPNRMMASRVSKILDAPLTSRDPLLDE